MDAGAHRGTSARHTKMLDFTFQAKSPMVELTPMYHPVEAQRLPQTAGDGH